MAKKQPTWAESVRSARTNLPARLGQEPWTQAQLAEALGVSSNMIAMWERGERNASSQSLRILAYCYALVLKGIDPRSI